MSLNDTNHVPQPFEARLRQAIAAHQRGALAVAERQYTTLTTEEPARADVQYLLGTIRIQLGRVEDAVAALELSIRAKPNYAIAHNNLGQALRDLNRLPEAVSAFERAVQLDPNLGEAHYNLGGAYEAAGQLDEAVAAYRAARRMLPHAAAVANNLGMALFALGDMDAAAESLIDGLKLDAGLAELYNNLGYVHAARGMNERALDALDYALRIKPGYTDALTNRANVLEKLDRRDEAIKCYRRVLEHDPDNLLVRARLRLALGKVVPAWHFPMMNDQPRNCAYEQAIRAVITPETTVLDIGTGAGLLTMMAAKLGAKHVASCEMVREVAATAREIVALNGQDKNVHIHAVRSNDLDPEQAMGGPADVIVSEILSSDLLGEAVLPAMEDAKRRLIKPGGVFVPYAVAACGMLAGGSDVELRAFASVAHGFDVSPFNAFSPLRFSVRRGNYPYALYSDPFEPFSFDFYRSDYFPAERKLLRIPVTSGGRCQGVVQWIKLHLHPNQPAFENHPDTPNPASGWSHMFHAFEQSIDILPGDVVRLFAEHDRLSLFLHFDGIEKAG